MLLVDGFIAHKDDLTASNLYTRTTGDSAENVRTRLTALREKLHGKVFVLPDLRQYEFEIPKGQPYRLEPAKTVSQSLLWAPHTRNDDNEDDKVLVHTYERLFFRHKTAYVRDVRVNQTGDLKKIINELLPCLPADSSASMHYVSSGEIKAAIVLQNFFLNTCHKAAELSTGAEINKSRQNLIVLGSARLGTSQLSAPKYETFKIFDHGIREGKKSHQDKSDTPQRRNVHVLLSRRQTLSGDCVQTVIEASHGRAIQGVCEALTAKDNSLCSNLIANLKGQHDAMPSLFQAIFKVVLVTETDFATRATSDTQLIAAQPYFPDKQQFKTSAVNTL